MKKFLVFDIWGDFAHFRKIYTTSSPLSYDFPTRTALCGIIAAIVGLKKSSNPGVDEEYLNYFYLRDTDIGVHILAPVKKIRMNINHIDTKRNWRLEKGSRTQIRAEFIKDPKYRIYFSSNHKEVYDKLRENLNFKRTVYTISLGISELLANFSFVGEFDSLKLSGKQKIQSNNVIPSDREILRSFKISSGDMLQRDILPNEMNDSREVVNRREFVYKTQWEDSDKLELNNSDLSKVEGIYKLSNGDNIFIL